MQGGQYTIFTSIRPSVCPFVTFLKRFLLLKNYGLDFRLSGNNGNIESKAFDTRSTLFARFFRRKFLTYQHDVTHPHTSQGYRNFEIQKRSGRPRKSWDEVLENDRKKLGMDSADPQNRSEWRGRL